MTIVWSAVGILLVVVLVLRIAKMTGGITATVKTMHGTFDTSGNFNPGGEPAVAPLPTRTPEELQQIHSSMPIEWATYAGATPPIRLKVRGASREMYRRVCRQYIDEIGQTNVERLSSAQLESINRVIMAETYVVDWEGAQYPNGSSMPFSPANLALLLAKDPHLEAFLTEQAHRISPKW